MVAAFPWRLTVLEPFSGLDRCPLGHPIDDVAVRCPACRRFVLFLPRLYNADDDSGRLWSRAYGVTIIVAAVIVFAVFRYSQVIWPLYWFLLLGIVHLYAAAFSRGAALASAAWFLTAATITSAITAAVHGRVHPSGAIAAVTNATLTIVPVLAWLLTTTYMFLLGWKGISSIKAASSYFLAAATLTLGFWGIWLFYLENDLVTGAIYHVAVAVGLLLPVLSILFLFVLPGRVAMNRRPWLLSLGALALVVLAANLILIEPLVTAVGYLLGQFFPRMIGAAPLTDISVGWLGGHDWRALVTSAMLLVAVSLIAVKATQEASRVAARSASGPAAVFGPRSGPAEIADSPAGQVITGEVVTAQESSSALTPMNQITVALDRNETLGQQALAEASFGGRYLGAIAYLFVANVLETVYRAFRAVLPSVAFSVLSMLIVLVLGKIGEYARHGPFLNAVSLWGMVLTIPAGVVVLCAIAFDFSPAPERGPANRAVANGETSNRRRIPGVPLVVIASGAVLTSLGYFLASLASWALAPLLWPDAFRPFALFSGDLYYANLAIATVTLVLLAALYAISRPDEDGNQSSKVRPAGQFFNISAAVIFVAVAGAGVYLGAAPIRSTLDFATGPYSPAAEQALRSRLPVDLAGRCTRDYLLVPGQSASVDCRGAGAIEVSYHAFDSTADVDHWYRQTLRARDVATGVGACGQQWPAENSYSNSDGGGRVACYVDRRGAWMLWTDNATLGIAFRSDGQVRPLFADWSAGAFWLVSR